MALLVIETSPAPKWPNKQILIDFQKDFELIE